MKKIIAAALAALMTVSLAACGSSASGTASGSAAEAASGKSESSGDVSYIKGKGKLVVGITDFAPMDYKDDNGDWIGFDADLAKKVGKDLGVDVEFTEIDWDNKILELNNKSVDVVWNGMTLTDEVKSSMACTNPYLANAQTVVLPKDKLSTLDESKGASQLKNLQLAVESGSAGESVAKDNGLNYTALQSQADALMEVNAGTSDGAIIDLLMAGAMIGEGTDYPNLGHALRLSEEQYVVGCRKGSDLCNYINDEFAKFEQDGSLEEIAKKYGVQDAMITGDASSAPAEASSTAASDAA